MIALRRPQAAAQAAGITVLCLFGGLLLGIVAGNTVFNALPGHSVANPSAGHIAVSATPVFLGLLGGGALWGAWLGRLAGSPERRRMAVAGMLGFAPVVIVAAIGLQLLEFVLLARLDTGVPLHRQFTLLFVPAALVIAGTGAWAIGRGLRRPVLARRLFLHVGLPAALAFLVVNLTMEALGWIVGGPGAAERFTMLTVMFAGDLGAALVGGAALGLAVLERLPVLNPTASPPAP